MKLKDVIEHVDELRPGNPCSDDMKTNWINNLESRIQTEVFLLGPGELISHDYGEDAEKELLVGPPHDDMYCTYLQAMIDFAQGEYKQYHNTITMYNAMWASFAAWFYNTYNPVEARTAELGTVSRENVALCTLPPYSILTRLVCRIETPFESGEELTLKAGDAILMGTSDMDVTKAGIYLKAPMYKAGALGAEIKAELTSDSEGVAVVYGNILRRAL